MPSDLEGLLERVKAAKGPDREIDYHIHAWVKGWRAPTDEHRFTWQTWEKYQFGDPNDNRKAIYIAEDGLPLYSDSVDAALALVDRLFPDGWWRVEGGCTVAAVAWVGAHDEDNVEGVEAATPALALLAACLTALIEQRKAEPKKDDK